MSAADDATWRWLGLTDRDLYGTKNWKRNGPSERPTTLLDPFKRPWVSGRRPWQYKDRPKYDSSGKFHGKSADFIIIDEITPVEKAKRLIDMDFAKTEERVMAHRQMAFYGTSLWHSQQRAKAMMDKEAKEAKEELEAARQRALKSIRYKARLEHALRQLP